MKYSEAHREPDQDEPRSVEIWPTTSAGRHEEGVDLVIPWNGVHREWVLAPRLQPSPA